MNQYSPINIYFQCIIKLHLSIDKYEKSEKWCYCTVFFITYLLKRQNVKRKDRREIINLSDVRKLFKHQAFSSYCSSSMQCATVRLCVGGVCCWSLAAARYIRHAQGYSEIVLKELIVLVCASATVLNNFIVQETQRPPHLPPIKHSSWVKIFNALLMDFFLSFSVVWIGWRWKAQRVSWWPFQFHAETW